MCELFLGGFKFGITSEIKKKLKISEIEKEKFKKYKKNGKFEIKKTENPP